MNQKAGLTNEVVMIFVDHGSPGVPARRRRPCIQKLPQQDDSAQVVLIVRRRALQEIANRLLTYRQSWHGRTANPPIELSLCTGYAGGALGFG